jgi:transposase
MSGRLGRADRAVARLRDRGNRPRGEWRLRARGDARLAGSRPARVPGQPFKLRQFARASGVLAKNDPLDTRMIASFVAIMPTRLAQPRPPAIERLAEMLAVRRQLNAEKVAAANASRLLEDAMLQRLSRRRIARLAADINMLDSHLVEIVESEAALAHRY